MEEDDLHAITQEDKGVGGALEWHVVCFLLALVASAHVHNMRTGAAAARDKEQKRQLMMKLGAQHEQHQVQPKSCSKHTPSPGCALPANHAS